MAMKDVIEIVNFVKARASNSRLFQELRSSCGASHQQLLFHSEYRWLSRGKVFARVIELQNYSRNFFAGEIFRAGPKISG